MAFIEQFQYHCACHSERSEESKYGG